MKMKVSSTRKVLPQLEANGGSKEIPILDYTWKEACPDLPQIHI